MANANYNAVGVATSSCVLVPQNSRRTELIVTNNSVATLYVGFGSNKVTATNFAVALPFGGTFVTSVSDRVNGVWASAASGQANVTEVF